MKQKKTLRNIFIEGSTFFQNISIDQPIAEIPHPHVFMNKLTKIFKGL